MKMLKVRLFQEILVYDTSCYIFLEVAPESESLDEKSIISETESESSKGL